MTSRLLDPASLDDDAFVRAFAALQVAPGCFHHRDHVRLAWLYLRRHPVTEALELYAAGLKRFAASVGKPGLYHETITWAFLLLIRERAERRPHATFDAFANANPDLLTWEPSALRRFYEDETLRSDLARRVFVMPDRLQPIAD
jgi:hypothetical protein